ncbi:hypothetical protein VNO77_23299 [Canavalia gladiata]|uniref:Uncharacterized protein n=1 Tax=Canavalia gladiata TaxID=3824 RepID=A0AAN9L6P6_CANGL
MKLWGQFWYCREFFNQLNQNVKLGVRRQVVELVEVFFWTISEEEEDLAYPVPDPPQLVPNVVLQAIQSRKPPCLVVSSFVGHDYKPDAMHQIHSASDEVSTPSLSTKNADPWDYAKWCDERENRVHSSNPKDHVECFLGSKTKSPCTNRKSYLFRIPGRNQRLTQIVHESPQEEHLFSWEPIPIHSDQSICHGSTISVLTEERGSSEHARIISSSIFSLSTELISSPETRSLPPLQLQEPVPPKKKPPSALF